MMENLYYSPFDLAVIISSMNFGLQKENELINFIWKNEQDFIQPEYRNSKRKFVLNIYYWTNYLNNKADIDLEFPAVKNDMISVGAEIAESQYISNFSNLDLFFKSLRIRIIFGNKKGYVRIKFRTLLRQYGYRRRSERLVDYINTCIDFYRLKPYLRGGVECDIRTVDIDEMIIFKLAEKSNDLQIEEFNKMEIHDLDYLLDMVRAKYYNSPNLRRPTISWTNDYPTDYYGCYTYYNNHIVISRVLNDKRVTTKMISMVIYHESLHQDFAEHNDDFNKKISLFPNYEKLDKKLRDFIDNVHEELQYPSNFNSFTRGKKRIIYISLPYADNYPNAFLCRDEKILVDFEADINFVLSDFQEDDMVVFLVENGNHYHIVGWCTNGLLLPKPKFENLSCYGDYDFAYQYVSDYKNTYVIPPSCCGYIIDKSFLPKEFVESNCGCFTMNDEDIQPDIQYINSYCEGYLRIGFDPDSMSAFENISLRTLKNIQETSYRNVCVANKIYQMEPTIENLINRAKIKKQCWLLTSSLEDYLRANQQDNTNIFCVCEIIKLFVVLHRTDEAVPFYRKYDDKLPHTDEQLNRCLKLLE